MKLYRLGALLALICAAIAVAVPASAQEAMPTACAGDAFTDPEKDAITFTENPQDLAGDGVPAPPNMDITKVFFNLTTDDAGKKKLTANIVVKNLSKTVGTAFKSGKVEYRITWDAVQDFVYVSAVNTNGTFAYTYRSFDRPVPGGPGVGTDKATTGRIFEGDNGVIQIDMPAALAKPGVKLAGIYAVSQEPGTFLIDEAPDAGSDSTLEYTTVDCPAEEPTGTATPEPTSTATPEPTSTPTSTPTPQQGGQQQQGQPQQTTPSGTQPAQPNPGAGQPATPAQPAKGKAVRKKAKSCASKAKARYKGKKNAKKLKAALKKCKKAKSKKR